MGNYPRLVQSPMHPYTFFKFQKFILELSLSGNLWGLISNNHQSLLNGLRRNDNSPTSSSPVSNGAFKSSSNGAPDGGTGQSGSSALHDLMTKLGEMGMFRDILCHQLETLQSYFDASSGVDNNHNTSLGHCNTTSAKLGRHQLDGKMCNGFHDNHNKWEDDCSESSENQTPPHGPGK